MNNRSKFGERNASAPEGQPLTLADRIEPFVPALNARQLATLLAVSPIMVYKVYKLAKSNRLPAFRIGTCVRFDPRAIANWLRAHLFCTPSCFEDEDWRFG